MSKIVKDRPLLLRRRVSEYDRIVGQLEGDRIDVETGDLPERELSAEPVASALFLDMDAWPPRHEFGWDFLAKTPEATYDPVAGKITFELANARAIYRIVDEVEIDGEPRTSIAGTWAVLESGSVD